MNRISMWYETRKKTQEAAKQRRLPKSAQLGADFYDHYKIVIKNHKIVEHLGDRYTDFMLSHAIENLKYRDDKFWFSSHLKYNGISHEAFIKTVVDEIKNYPKTTMYNMVSQYCSWAIPLTSPNGRAFFKSNECKQLADEVAGWFEKSEDIYQTIDMLVPGGMLDECVRNRMVSMFEAFKSEREACLDQTPAQRNEELMNSSASYSDKIAEYDTTGKGNSSLDSKI